MIADDLAEVTQLTLRNAVIYDRFAGTGVLGTDDARALGCLGYAARERCGDRCPRRPPHHRPTGHRGTADTGDVLARYAVRRDEFAASTDMITHLVESHTGPTQFTTTTEPAQRAGSDVGIVEGWRGTIVHRVETDDTGCRTRAKIVDPSWFNWPALPMAMTETIVPDFPLVNKSFNLSYVGNDL
ncbi:hypothetical protein AB0L63_29920 [Nocardia sp. NPDC051990]|uniref:NADH-quinone oxidoreductase subunit D-related protein n=1 Tax=Nocardia sp. NPDC051990 TaxID=3155285 RepID=UPI00342C2B83